MKISDYFLILKTVCLSVLIFIPMFIVYIVAASLLYPVFGMEFSFASAEFINSNEFKIPYYLTSLLLILPTTIYPLKYLFRNADKNKKDRIMKAFLYLTIGLTVIETVYFLIVDHFNTIDVFFVIVLTIQFILIYQNIIKNEGTFKLANIWRI